MPRDRGGAAVWEEREDPPLCLSAAGASLGCTESSRPHSSRQPRGHSIHAQENARIMKGLTVRKTFVLGSYAFRLSPVEKKKYNDMTHKWTCLLRALNGEDLTYCVKKVVFELDPSFVNPKRTLTHPPYEVSEAGWGEFQISVKVHFLDDSLPPAELRHFLRLNPEGGHVVGPCVAAETLDEVLIHEPKESFYDVLMEGPHKPAAPHHLEKFFLQQQPRFDEQMKLLVGAAFGAQGADEKTPMLDAQALQQQMVLQQQQAQVLLQQQLYHAQQQQYLMHAAPGVFFPSDAKRGAGAPCPQQVSPFAQPPGPYPNGGSAPGNQGVVFPRAPDAAAQASSSVPHKE